MVPVVGWPLSSFDTPQATIPPTARRRATRATPNSHRSDGRRPGRSIGSSGGSLILVTPSREVAAGPGGGAAGPDVGAAVRRPVGGGGVHRRRGAAEAELAVPAQ